MLTSLLNIGAGSLALAAAFLPRRYWPRLEHLPIAKVAILSSILTILTAGILGIGGFIRYADGVSRNAADVAVRIAEGQLSGQLASDSTLNVAPVALALMSPLAFALFTPLGLLSTYLGLSGFLRALTWVADEPCGDPLLTTVDTLWHRLVRSTKDASRRQARQWREGDDVPDRLYEAQWAGVEDADYVVVASRRKPDWEAGTFVITSDKWFLLGTPFDMQLASGLRTVYPLKEHTANEVMRRGVPYELPPLRKGPPKRTV